MWPELGWLLQGCPTMVLSGCSGLPNVHRGSGGELQEGQVGTICCVLSATQELQPTLRDASLYPHPPTISIYLSTPPRELATFMRFCMQH